MKARLISTATICCVIMLIITIIFTTSEKKINLQDEKSEQIIALNEIEQLTSLALEEIDINQYAVIQQKISTLQENILQINRTNSEDQNKHKQIVVFMCGVGICFVIIIFMYVYFAILRPFEKMKGFAKEIAKGEFDIPLEYERSNYFGEFTWAFDSMRREVTKARSSEHEAIENNKTVIATLSHDIKTPIASILAYSEGLEANLDKDAQKRSKYLSVIMRKCTEVAKLTDDLFLHSISSLDKLAINSKEFEIYNFFTDIITELAAEQGDINYTAPIFKAEVFADKNRLIQIIGNIINNSRKYAKTKIDVNLSYVGDNIEITLRDYGKGINNEDIPFVFDKFYRGKNCGKEQGSGLGLYIVKYIVTQMKGYVMLHNYDNGLEVKITLPAKIIS